MSTTDPTASGVPAEGATSPSEAPAPAAGPGDQPGPDINPEVAGSPPGGTSDEPAPAPKPPSILERIRDLEVQAFGYHHGGPDDVDIDPDK